MPADLLYESHEKAEEAILALMAVLPALIVEIARDIHNAWADGRSPKEVDDDVMARVERIVREKFGA